MRKLRIIVLIFTIALCLVGCGRVKYPDLPNDSIAFTMGEYIDAEDDNASYSTVQYGGRTYIPYGTIGKTINSNDIDACLGYFVENDKECKNRKLYSLTQDQEHNFLMDYTDVSFMEQPTFWRAVDTKGIDITIPDYIDSLEYSFWM